MSILFDIVFPYPSYDVNIPYKTKTLSRCQKRLFYVPASEAEEIFAVVLAAKFSFLLTRKYVFPLSRLFEDKNHMKYWTIVMA